jgi:6-phosphogluconolactonase
LDLDVNFSNMNIFEMEGNPQIIIANNASEFARTGADIFISNAEKAVQRNGRYLIAISGGDTPVSMQRLLAGDSYRPRAPWSDTHIFWVDERCVPVNHTSSNYGRALRDFLEAVPIPSTQVHNMPVNLPVEKGALKYEQELIAFFQLQKGEAPAFDLIFLGLGPDGHTASLFPGSSALEEKHRLILPVKGGCPDVDRLTMTLPVLNNARKIVFLVSGKGKARIVHELLTQGQKEFPARKIRPVNGDLLWVLDRSAASLMP